MNEKDLQAGKTLNVAVRCAVRLLSVTLYRMQIDCRALACLFGKRLERGHRLQLGGEVALTLFYLLCCTGWVLTEVAGTSILAWVHQSPWGREFFQELVNAMSKINARGPLNPAQI